MAPNIKEGRALWLTVVEVSVLAWSVAPREKGGADGPGWRRASQGKVARKQRDKGRPEEEDKPFQTTPSATASNQTPAQAGPAPNKAPPLTRPRP